MTVDTFRSSITGASLLELAHHIDAIAAELKSRELRLQAAALRIDADNLRRLAGISARQHRGTSVTDELPSSPREEAADERKA